MSRILWPERSLATLGVLTGLFLAGWGSLERNAYRGDLLAYEAQVVHAKHCDALWMRDDPSDDVEFERVAYCADREVPQHPVRPDFFPKPTGFLLRALIVLWIIFRTLDFLATGRIRGYTLRHNP